MARAVEVGDYIQDQFREARQKLPLIGDVRGKGLMVGVELINADSSPAGEIVKAVIKESRTRGIVLTKCGASTLRFAPPLIITREQAEKEATAILEILHDHQW